MLLLNRTCRRTKMLFIKKIVYLSFFFCFWICRDADDSYTTECVYPSGVRATWCAIAPPHFASRAPVVIIRCLVLFAAVQYSKLVNRVACFSESSSFFSSPLWWKSHHRQYIIPLSPDNRTASSRIQNKLPALVFKFEEQSSVSVSHCYLPSQNQEATPATGTWDRSAGSAPGIRAPTGSTPTSAAADSSSTRAPCW